MRFVKQSVAVRSREFQRDYVLEQIEDAARTCYKSEDKKCQGSAERLVRSLIASGHEAMLEHGPNLSMRFITDRGITHEIVRHRLFSFAQESTRYVKYESDIEFIFPEYFEDTSPLLRHAWSFSDVLEYTDTSRVSELERCILEAFLNAEASYRHGLHLGLKPQQIRDVLSTDVKSEIVVTGNIREWRHFFLLRLDKAAHPRMRLLAKLAFDEAYDLCDVVFEDIAEKLKLADEVL